MSTPVSVRDYSLLGTTQSLCPECLSVVPAKIITRGKRVYFRKTCPQHGVREDFICSDVAQYDQLEYVLPARMPREFGVEPDKGCPLDCGLCTEHEQHTCVGLVEITSSCNLTCPMCYASSAPGGKHLPLDECKRAIDRLVEVEGRAEVCQLSGGEPTVHPQLEEIIDYALGQKIDYVMINTNGIRLGRDARLVEKIAQHRERMEIYFQLDGLNDDVNQKLRGESLHEAKMRALDALQEAGIHVTLVATLQGGVNDDQIGPLVKFGLSRPNVTGISFQPATYSGRHVLPEEIERRITFPDVIRAIAEQTDGLFHEEDFLPLPCAHPNCHQLAIAYRTSGSAVPVTRFIDAKQNLDLLANGISFTRLEARNLILKYLGRQTCCSGGCGPVEDESCGGSDLPLVQLGGLGAGNDPGGRGGIEGKPRLQDPGAAQGSSAGHPLAQIGGAPAASKVSHVASDFFSRVVEQQIGAADLFRITITSFLDAYNFDVRRVMKCCTHHVLPSGHVIPFCAYNVLYREGHVPLPTLRELAVDRQK